MTPPKLYPIVTRGPGNRGLVPTEIPEAAAYVVMDNITFSKILETRVVDVFPCESVEQANEVLRYAKANPYEKRPRVVLTTPKTGDDRILVIFPPQDVRGWAEFGRSTLLSGG